MTYRQTRHEARGACGALARGRFAPGAAARRPCGTRSLCRKRGSRSTSMSACRCSSNSAVTVRARMAPASGRSRSGAVVGRPSSRPNWSWCWQRSQRHSGGEEGRPQRSVARRRPSRRRALFVVALQSGACSGGPRTVGRFGSPVRQQLVGAVVCWRQDQLHVFRLSTYHESAESPVERLSVGVDDGQKATPIDRANDAVPGRRVRRKLPRERVQTCPGTALRVAD